MTRLVGSEMCIRDSPWIHQPFEPYDSMRPEKLLEKWKV
jgi:hypothetical protein